MQALAPALRHLPRLEQLILSRNNISEAGAAALAHASADGALPRLRILHLEDNHIGEGGVQALAAAVAGGALATLAELDLALNEVGAGAEALAAACASADALPQLKFFDLRDNRIDVAGMQALVMAIAGGGLAALEKVYLESVRNPCSAEPVEAALRQRRLGRES